MRRAVFLDRDGVINAATVRNGKPYPPLCLDELFILPGVPEALAMLTDAGYELIVVTNQPDVARGKLSRTVVEQMHTWLHSQLPIDEFVVCYHDDADHCKCRKPAPGMLLDASERRGIDLSASFMIGDRWRDIDAGNRAGCKTIFLDYHYAEKIQGQPMLIVPTLLQAVKWIIDQENE